MISAAHNLCKSCRWLLGRRRTWFVVLAAAVLVPTGCVRRRLTVRSNPPGALVYVDNQQIGTTPCAVDFTYYGTREIRLVKPGFETLTVKQPIPTPWYEIPPVDFISENLTPVKLRDNRTVMYELTPQIIVPTQLLLDRANELRSETQQGAVVPAAAPSPANIPPPPEATVPVPPGTFGPPPSTPAPYLPFPQSETSPPMPTPLTATPAEPSTAGEPSVQRLPR